MPTFRELVATERPLVLPGAHDALSALLIKRAGFKAYFVGGFPVAGVRYGVPDIALLGMREFADAYRDILAVSDLPVLVDADNGYGDVKNIVYLVHTYERLGAQAIFFEDQVSPKRCGHIAGKALIPAEEMEARIRAAAQERVDPRTFLIARTDAREVYGLDEALRRGERYVRAGADGLFIEAPESMEEMAQIGRAFDVPQLANMLEGGRTPILPPAELERLGFRIVIYGISLLLRIAATMQSALEDRASETPEPRARQLRDAQQSCGYPTPAYQLDRPSSQMSPPPRLSGLLSQTSCSSWQDVLRPLDKRSHISVVLSLFTSRSSGAGAPRPPRRAAQAPARAQTFAPVIVLLLSA